MGFLARGLWERTVTTPSADRSQRSRIGLKDSHGLPRDQAGEGSHKARVLAARGSELAELHPQLENWTSPKTVDTQEARI
jgi:hypothetical protein